MNYQNSHKRLKTKKQNKENKLYVIVCTAMPNSCMHHCSSNYIWEFWIIRNTIYGHYQYSWVTATITCISLLRLHKVFLLLFFWFYKSLKNDHVIRLFFFLSCWKRNGEKTVKCTLERELWVQDRHTYSQVTQCNWRRSTCQYYITLRCIN